MYPSQGSKTSFDNAVDELKRESQNISYQYLANAISRIKFLQETNELISYVTGQININ